MIEVIGVTFDENSKTYYFSPNNLKINKGDFLIVETERGLQFGTAVSEINKMNSDKINSVLKEVIRIATDKDIERLQKNTELAKESIERAKEIVESYQLRMRIINASFTFDRSQLLFHFISDERIDFRKLAKELANIYKTRIELRQIGVRDRAKEVGGLGTCGRCLCCSSFLKTFDSLSINMAKNQNLALTPNKINGACGRLLCCLGYENDTYEECRKGMPNFGERINTKDGSKRVIGIDILSRTYRTINEKDEIEETKLD